MFLKDNEMKRNNKIKLIVLGVLYISLIAGFIVLALQDYSPVEREIMHYTNDSAPAFEVFDPSGESEAAEVTLADRGMALVIYRNQLWEQGADRDPCKKQFGGNYEFVLKNFNDFTVSEWCLKITCVPTTHVDSYWRAASESAKGEDDAVIIIVEAIKAGTEDRDQTIIHPEKEVHSDNDRVSFGMTIHSPRSSLGIK